MKNLKLFESNYNENKLKRVQRENDKICDLIRAFFIIEKFPGTGGIRDVIRYYFQNISVYETVIIAEITYDEGDEKEHILINGDDKKNLYNFMESPDNYKKMKKYNL